MKKTLTAALTAAALLVAAGCGGGSSSSKSDAPVDLRMTIWSANAQHLALFNQIAAGYKKDHPEIGKISFESIPFDSYTTTLTTQIGGGNVPDLAWIFESNAPDFVTSGALEPIDKDADLLPSTTADWEQDGKLYAYPFSTSPLGVFVNTDLVKAAGRPAPAQQIASGTWTWEEAAKTAAAVQALGKGGVVVGDFDYKGWDTLNAIWAGWGARPWSEDGKTCQFDQPAMVDAMTFVHNLIFTQKGMPGPGVTKDFFAGDSGMILTQISRAALLQKAKFHWDLVPLPKGPAGDYSVVGQAGIGVFKRGKHADAAKQFLAYFTNAENSAKLAQFFPPPRKSQLNAATLAKANPLLKPAQLDSVVVKGIETGTIKPSHTGYAELQQTVRAALDPLWKPDADVKTVLSGVCSKINPLLAK
ncbi:ABC transporter substrate-binding protein [Kribbella kalugense]|uniref:Multiple sugar transport system substrate-binding protein n=1 Tax=Kribbella kalugense TaxID=2512221 RepID=A0A4R7ZIX2_9ACTN|nr:sugar ABC transporter substrate-binding protein [Kribbella kalugense]TDW17352.1 multiple sugar transport system substrate-binding protein [Kribbella kalugense]